MKRTVICLFVALAFTLPILPQPGSHATALPAGQEVKKIKPLKGEAVKFLVAQIRARNKGFDRAMRDMEKRGKQPIWEESAAVPLPAKKRQQVASSSVTFRPASFAPPQDIISDGNGGEMIFVTFSGDDSYWDGTVYVHDNYREATYNAVVDDYGSLDSSVWDVIDELYYPPDGGDPTRDYPCTGRVACLDQGPVTKRNDRRREAELVNASSTSRGPTAAAPFGGGWFRSWWGCTRTGCQAGAQSCGSTSTRFRPFFICTAVRCTASAIACI